MKKTSLSWLGERLPAVVILGSLVFPACSSKTSNTSTAANNQHFNNAETPSISEHCDPNYDGCVPIARDVDCAGGTGDGPAYVKGPVKVIGRDIYGLDRDGDGIGCE